MTDHCQSIESTAPERALRRKGWALLLLPRCQIVRHRLADKLRLMSAVLSTFDINNWLQQSAVRSAELHVSKPYQVGCWTKDSSNQGSQLRHGDTSGIDAGEKVI